MGDGGRRARLERILGLVAHAREHDVPVVFIQEVHKPSLVDIGRELDGAEGPHCIEGDADDGARRRGSTRARRSSSSASAATRRSSRPSSTSSCASYGTRTVHPRRRAHRRLHPLHGGRRAPARLRHPRGRPTPSAARPSAAHDAALRAIELPPARRARDAEELPGDASPAAGRLRVLMTQVGRRARPVADEPALPRDMQAWLELTLADEPWPHILGDTIPRGGPTGVVWHGGREIAALGEPDRVDMCFSIAKSALSTVAGLAWADGLLATSTTRPVDRSGARAARLTDHLAPPADPDERLARRAVRHALVGGPAGPPAPGRAAARAPGARFAYNDIRTNLLSLGAHAAARAARSSDVLRERVMDPDRRRRRVELARPARHAHRGRARRRHGREPLGRRAVGDRARQLARLGLLHLRERRGEGCLARGVARPAARADARAARVRAHVVAAATAAF